MTSSFLEPEVPDITETIPTHISARTSNPVYVNRTTKADVAINDMAFQFAISDSNVYQRETADFRREQIDTSKEPGEQSLNQWWVRDQDSWHKGAGINFYEPGSVETTQYRFDSSLGVDVWTEGQVSLLKRCPNLIAATSGQSSFATAGVVSGVNVFFGVVAGTMFRHDGTTRTNYTGYTGFSSEPAVAGAKVLCAGTNGLWAGDVGGTTVTNLWTTALGTQCRAWWVKSRIIASQGHKLWDLTLAGGSLDSTTPLFTHPSATWTWTGVAEAPGAILAAGYDNGYGYIYKFVLDDAGAGLSPTLGSPIQVADFPPGEEVHSLRSYLSTYVAIGTSRGIRIGLMDNTGTIQYGPLNVETTLPVRALGARDRFVYAGVEADLDGFSGLARIDLSQEIAELRFAWAYDAQAHDTGPVQSVSFLGVSDRVLFGILGKGIFLQSLDLFEATGYIQSGKIRYGTSEPKTFNLLKVRALIPDQCTIAINTISYQGTNTFLNTLGSAWDTDEDVTLRTLADFGQPYASFVLTLAPNTALTVSPVLQSMQVKATPQPRIQRNIKMPLRLIDVEQDRNGVKQGRTGSAATRLALLEQMEQDHSVVLIQDYTSGEAYTAQIRKIEFVRDTPTSRNRRNFGGIVNVLVLKL
jgi:hypothetical protein